MRNWTLEELKKELSARKPVRGWIVAQEHTHRRERYFIGEGEGNSGALGIDQDRDVRSQSISARIFVDIGKPGRQGEITKKLFPMLPLAAQLDAAIDSALQTDHQEWSLPAEVPAELPKLSTADPMIAEDIEKVMSELTSEIAEVVGQQRQSRFNSAELFLSIHDRELHLSNGLKHRSSQSRIYSEAAYSISRPGKDGAPESDEYMNTSWAVSLRDFSIRKLFGEASDRAEHTLDVKRPSTGKYPVIIDAENLAMLFNGHVAHLGGFNAYNRLPYLKPGTELIPGAEGDLLTITLDPTLEYGADTTALSDQGISQTRLPLVSRNQVLATAADKQYADYLGAAPTTARGNVVIEPGTLTYQELTRQAPAVIEILQFSALFADANSGTFSSEIRLAKLHDNVKGTVTWIKGGSLSGSINENFRKARLSRETVKKAHFASGGGSPGQGYLGPAYALMNDVSIVG
jgi:predicted Zn-dependent protease